MADNASASVNGKLVTSQDLAAVARRALDACRANSGVPDAVLTLHGLTIRLHCKNPAFLGHCISRIVNEPSKALDPQKTIDIHVISPEDGMLAPPPFWGEETYIPRAVETLLEGTPFRASYFHDLGLWHMFDMENAIAIQWMQAPDAYPPWEPAGPLRIFMHWALSTPQSRLVHAGTLGQDGKAVLLAGRGGSGKSSTVTAGIARGLQSAGDDYVHVRADGDGFNVYPVFSTLKQDAKGLARLGLSRIAQSGPANWQDKHEFSALDIGGLPLTGPLAVEAILVPVIGGGENTVISPASKSEAMLALAPSALFQMPGERDGGVRFFAGLVRKLPCFRITLGRDPESLAARIREFLEQQQ